MAPSKYPNLEISDEGQLCFNVENTKGTVEVTGFPFGFNDIMQPSILVSFPGKAEDVPLNFLNKLNKISNGTNKFKLFATFSTDQEILEAYRRDEHPPLTCSQNFKEILEMKKNGVFFSYLGVYFPVLNEPISKVEQTIRKILSKLE